jgi:hypothetical protein
MASPMMSPGSSPGLNKRPRCNSDEEATFLLDQSSSEQLQAAIEAHIGPEMRKRVKASLQETLDDIHREYPEEAQDLRVSRRRANSDLSDYVEKASSRPGSCRATPATMHPRGSPEIGLPDVPEHPPPLFLPSVADEALFLEHDGLLDHEQLMQAIYLSQGLDFFEVQNKAKQFLQDIGLRPHDLGVKNTDEEGRTLMNQCFYLSIAYAYLGHLFSDEVAGLALRLKRAIEASVLSHRPGLIATGAGIDGENEAMAFADFLPIVMHASESDQDSDDEPNILASLVVCILDSVNGHVEVYIGPKYAKLDETALLQRNLILLWYTPGHYQCLVCDDSAGSKVLMTYDEFKDVLTKHGVTYIETME